MQLRNYIIVQRTEPVNTCTLQVYPKLCSDISVPLPFLQDTQSRHLLGALT